MKGLTTRDRNRRQAEWDDHGETYPMAFVLSYGEGRVFHCTLGHDAEALRVPAVGELYRRGTAWVAGMDDPAPADTEDDI